MSTTEGRAHAHTFTQNVHKHLIYHLGQVLRQALTGQLTSHILLLTGSSKAAHAVQNRDYYYLTFNIWGHLLGLKETEMTQEQTEENSYCKCTQTEK